MNRGFSGKKHSKETKQKIRLVERRNKKSKIPCCNYMKTLVDLDMVDEPLDIVNVGAARLSFTRFTNDVGIYATSIDYCPFCGAKLEEYKKGETIV